MSEEQKPRHVTKDSDVKNLKYGTAISRREAINFGAQVALDNTLKAAKGVGAATLVTNGIETITGKENPLLTENRKDNLMNTVVATSAGASIAADALEGTAKRRNVLRAILGSMGWKAVHDISKEIGKRK